MAKTTTFFDVAHPVMAADFDITVNALVATGSLTITTVPAGMIIDSISVVAPAMGSGTGLAVGDAGDKNRLFEDTDTAAATNSQMATVAPTATTGWGYQYDSDTVLQLTNTGGSTTTASDLVVTVKVVGRVDQSGSNYIDQ